MQMNPPRSRREGGVVLVTMALVLVGVFGCTGLAIDIGRMFSARNEAQAYCDSAATAAAMDLDLMARRPGSLVRRLRSPIRRTGGTSPRRVLPTRR